MLSLANDGPSMVVAPASVVSNWQRELVRFAPTMKCHLLSGQAAELRSDTLETLQAGDVLWPFGFRKRASF